MKIRSVKLPEDKDVIKVTIGKESFVVEIEALKEFVKKHGKRIESESLKDFLRKHGKRIGRGGIA